MKIKGTLSAILLVLFLLVWFFVTSKTEPLSMSSQQEIGKSVDVSFSEPAQITLSVDSEEQTGSKESSQNSATPTASLSETPEQQKLSQFVDINSELHQTFMEKINAKYPDQELKIGIEHSLEHEGNYYDSYVTNMGVEFHIWNENFYQRTSAMPNAYEVIQQELAAELEQLGDWNTENEVKIHQLLSELNNPDIQLIEVNCHSNFCLAAFNHPGKDYGYAALGQFLRLIRESREACSCKGVVAAAEKLNETTITFVFD